MWRCAILLGLATTLTGLPQRPMAAGLFLAAQLHFAHQSTYHHPWLLPVAARILANTCPRSIGGLHVANVTVMAIIVFVLRHERRWGTPLQTPLPIPPPTSLAIQDFRFRLQCTAILWQAPWFFQRCCGLDGLLVFLYGLVGSAKRKQLCRAHMVLCPYSSLAVWPHILMALCLLFQPMSSPSSYNVEISCATSLSWRTVQDLRFPIPVILVSFFNPSAKNF